MELQVPAPVEKAVEHLIELLEAAVPASESMGEPAPKVSDPDEPAKTTLVETALEQPAKIARLQPPLIPTPAKAPMKQAEVVNVESDEQVFISLGEEKCAICGDKCTSVMTLQKHIITKHCNQPNQLLDMLQKQQQIMNTTLSNQSIQQQTMKNIALTQNVIVGDIKEINKKTVKPTASPAPVLALSPPVTAPQETLASRQAPQDNSANTRRSGRPANPASARQADNTTMAHKVRQNVTEQAAIVNPQEQQSCAASILFMGDSIFRNVYMEKIEKKARNKVTVVKAYSSTYDNNTNNKFKSSNFTDIVPKELGKAKHDALVMQASSVDLTNYKTETNKEKQRQIAQSSNANMLSVATTAMANHPELKKVVLFERVPRFDELQELNKFANKDLHTQWLQCDKEFRDKLVIGKHNLEPHGRFANVQRLARWGYQSMQQKPDNIHMVGPSGKMKMTDSILAVLASAGIIEEAGATGYFKEKSDKTSQSQSQAWQQAGGRRHGRAPRRRQEEPFRLPLSNRYIQGNF